MKTVLGGVLLGMGAAVLCVGVGYNIHWCIFLGVVWVGLGGRYLGMALGGYCARRRQRRLVYCTECGTQCQKSEVRVSPNFETGGYFWHCPGCGKVHGLNPVH